jgi:formate hydrogenlyase transcriptional activator
MNKEIRAVSSDAMEVIRAYAWPGNIRELQNFIERAVILSPGPVLQPPIAELKLMVANQSPTADRTLAQMERNYISEVLDQAGWVVAGCKGAAARLGLPRTTLMSRISKLGIHRQRLTEAAGPKGR